MPSRRNELELVRTFIAIDIPQENKEVISKNMQGLQHGAQFLNTRLNWTSERNLHLTLAFLGDCAPAQLRFATEAMQDSAKRCWPFALKIGAAALFPVGNVPRVLALKLTKDIDVLQVLQRSLVNGLRRRRFELELREFHPHLTLARLKNRLDINGLRKVAEERRIVKAGSFEVTEIKLVKSTLTADGAVYETLATVPLTAEHPIVAPSDSVE